MRAGLRALLARAHALLLARALALEALGDLIPRGRGRPGANLRGDLHLHDDEIEQLRLACEEAFGICIDQRAPAEWETLNDVSATIAEQLATEPA